MMDNQEVDITQTWDVPSRGRLEVDVRKMQVEVDVRKVQVEISSWQNGYGKKPRRWAGTV